MDISINAKDLCAKCSSLDIDSILSSPPKTYRGRFILNLGVNEHMNWRCSFCCLLAAVKPQPLNDSNNGLALYSFPILDRLWSLNDENAVLGVLRVVDTKGKGSRDRIEESLQRTGY